MIESEIENNLGLLSLFPNLYNPEAYSEPSQTSKMKRFAQKVNA